MYTQFVTPAYYQPLSPAQFLNQAAARLAPPVTQQVLPVYPVIPHQPVYRTNQNMAELRAFDKYTKGHPDLAISNLEESLAGKNLDNSDIDTMVILGRLYRETKQYDKSLNILKQASDLHSNAYYCLLIDPMPPNPINVELGKTYFAMGKIKEAKSYMQKEKVLYDFRKPFYNKEDAKDYDELTHILNVQG